MYVFDSVLICVYICMRFVYVFKNIYACIHKHKYIHILCTQAHASIYNIYKYINIFTYIFDISGVNF